MRWRTRIRRLRAAMRWPWWLTIAVWGPVVWMAWLARQPQWAAVAEGPVRQVTIRAGQTDLFGFGVADAEGRVYCPSICLLPLVGAPHTAEASVATVGPEGRITDTLLSPTPRSHWRPIRRLAVSPSGQRWWTLSPPWRQNGDAAVWADLASWTADGRMCGDWQVQISQWQGANHELTEEQVAIRADGERACLLASGRGIFRYELGADQARKLRANTFAATMLDDSGGLWSVVRGAVTYTDADGTPHGMNLADVSYSASLIAFATAGPWLYAEGPPRPLSRKDEEHIVYRFHRSGRTERLMDLSMVTLADWQFEAGCCLAVDSRGSVLCRASRRPGGALDPGQMTLARLEQQPLWRGLLARWSR